MTAPATPSETAASPAVAPACASAGQPRPGIPQTDSPGGARADCFADGLKPGSLVAAAAADLLAYSLKRSGHLAQSHPYSFHPDHVARADSVAELIALALADRDRGRYSGRPLTRVIYRAEGVLRAALARPSV